MLQFLYFVEGRSACAPEDMPGLGLGHVFGPGEPVARTALMANSPSGKPGLLVGMASEGLEYRAGRQTWLPAPGQPWMLGWETAAPPGPGDLRRERVLGVYRPPLGDGRAWTIPTALDAGGDCPLPKVRRVDPESGAIVKRPEPRFDDLRLCADLVAEAIRHGHELTPDEEARVCVAALAVNYRLGLHEASALALLTDEAVQYIAWALVDRVHWPDAAAAAQAAPGLEA